MASYLPLTDSGLLNWAENFVDQLTSSVDPTAVGLTLDDLTAYTTLTTTYADAYAAATHPSTRGNATVLAKNEAKAALIADSRRLAMAATNHPGTTNAQRQALGLTVRDNEPTPVPPPETAPLIDILSVKSRRFELRLRDAVTSSKRQADRGEGRDVVYVCR